jgi:FMN phosphatase YigB (HAD superfamily)
MTAAVAPADAAPWVWFDVDDVLVESTPLFQESLDRWTGTSVPWQTWTHNRFHQFYGIADDDELRIAQMKQRWKDDRILERSPLIEGVGEALRAIEAKGAKIGLLTARAWHENGVAITQAQVEQHRLPVSRIISMNYHETKAQFLQHTGTRVIGFIDDTPRHVEGCRTAGIDAVLMHQPWNTDADHLPRVHRLSEFVARLDPLLQPSPTPLAVPRRGRSPR